MKKFIGFPSIEQFRNVVREVKLNTDYKGADENGKPIYANDSVYPTILFTGTVKIHGTNAGVCSDGVETWAQSRNGIITPEHDNAGFATWAYKEREFLATIITEIRNDLQLEVGDILAIYGEWAGGNIQKGVAITGLPKFFTVFGARVVRGESYLWVPTSVWHDVVWEHCIAEPIHGLFSIFEFGRYEIKIDFNSPESVQNQLAAMTIKVEEECPVGSWWGKVAPDNTTGEGIVWTAYRGDGHQYCFKVKGEKHSASKVKTLAAVDIEKVNSVKECVDKVCTVNRMTQGFDWMALEGLDRIPQNLGAYLKWLNGDIFKEELDTVVESGLTPKDVTKEISNVGRKFFLENM